MDTINVNEQIATAYHEAGHAVAAVLLGLQLVRVSIAPTPERGSVGHTEVKPLRRVLPTGGEASPHQRFNADVILMMTIAGRVAESHFVGEDRKPDYDDLERINELFGQLCLTDREADAYQHWITIRVKTKLVNNLNWRGVVALAEALVEFEIIDGDYATDIIRRAWSRDAIA